MDLSNSQFKPRSFVILVCGIHLRMPGVPLTNNENERLIKRAVLNRKNAYFFKTEAGAKIGDVLLSIIETCALNKANPLGISYCHPETSTPSQAMSKKLASLELSRPDPSFSVETVELKNLEPKDRSIKEI